jgi:hypothetical protein
LREGALFKPNEALEPGIAERLLLRGLNPVQNVLNIGMHSHVSLLAANKFEGSFVANTFFARTPFGATDRPASRPEELIGRARSRKAIVESWAFRHSSVAPGKDAHRSGERPLRCANLMARTDRASGFASSFSMPPPS